MPFQLGMGEGLSQHFIKVGWRVALFDVNEDAGKKLGKLLVTPVP